MIDTETSLVIIETSNNIYNKKAYASITPKSVLCWIRTAAANSLGSTAPGWARLFSKYHSGTYNNQWMVLDLKMFTKGKPIVNDTFWVLEEVPGLIEAADQSSWLQSKGYWASYNVAYYRRTRTIAGEIQSHSDCMRARLFRALVPDVTSIERMKMVMAWNDYKHSSIAHGPDDAIMARGDLTFGRQASGGIDSKVASDESIREGLTTYGRAGPTTDNHPPFCWKKKFESTPHHGHPLCFDFKWEAFSPETTL